MTINELEQGMRNLIATQPMVTAGANGEVVNGVLSIIDAYRNMSFRVQSYPCQDVLKFTMSNEIAKMEGSLCSLVCQVMQERGINLMLYIAPTQNRFGPMVNQYGMINHQVDPNLMMGQMMYQQPQAPVASSPVMMQQMPNTMAMGGGMYNQMQPQMQSIAPNYGRGGARRQAPTFPGYDYGNKPQRLEPTQATEQSVRNRPVSQAKIKATPKTTAATQMGQVNKTPVDMPEEVSEPSAPSPAEMLMGGEVGGSKTKAPGRDYLLELLKK